MKWIKCSDQLPKKDGEYLVVYDDDYVTSVSFLKDSFWWRRSEDVLKVFPIYWMKLPPPPCPIYDPPNNCNCHLRSWDEWNESR